MTESQATARHAQSDSEAGRSARDTLITASAAASGVGGALLAALAGLCCAGLATVALLGAGGAVFAATLKPYKPLLLIASLAAIGFGFWYAYGRRVLVGGLSCPVRTGRVTRAVLWASAAIWLAAAIYQPGT